MGSDYLMLEEVLVELLDVVRGQVVDLRADHETYRQHIDGNSCEEETFQSVSVKEEGQDMHQEGEDRHSIGQAVRVEVFVADKLANIVVVHTLEGLVYTDPHETERHSNKPNDDKSDLLGEVDFSMLDIL